MQSRRNVRRRLYADNEGSTHPILSTQQLFGMALNHVLANMATKEDLATLRSEMKEGFASVRAGMRDIRNRLDAIEADLENHSGFAKEIDRLILSNGCARLKSPSVFSKNCHVANSPSLARSVIWSPNIRFLA
jgi:hypothetical protein